MNYTLDDLYHDVKSFNRIAGKDFVQTKKQLLEQIDLIQEELDEIRDGVIDDDPEEILDGATDVAVTFFGLVSQLKNLGFNFSGASLTTANNNLTKFVIEESVAKESVKALKEAEPDREFRYIFDNLTHQYAILDDNNKVRKPVGYIKNNLRTYIPANYKERINDN